MVFLDILAIESTIKIIEQSGNKALIVFNIVKPNTSLIRYKNDPIIKTLLKSKKGKNKNL